MWGGTLDRKIPIEGIEWIILMVCLQKMAKKIQKNLDKNHSKIEKIKGINSNINTGVVGCGLGWTYLHWSRLSRLEWSPTTTSTTSVQPTQERCTPEVPVELDTNEGALGVAT